MKFRAQRYPTRYPVTMLAPEAQLAATITSISNGGAGLLLQRDPYGFTVGDTVFLRHSGGLISTTIRWVHGNKIGVSFAKTLSPRELDHIRQGVSVSAPQRHHGPQLTELR